MEYRTWMPKSIYFHEVENSDKYVLGFNGAPIVFSDLLKAKEALDTFISEVTPLAIEKHNKEVESYWNMEKETETTLPKKKKVGVRGCVYLIESAGLYKLGRSKKLGNRMKTYRTENPHGITLIASKQVDDYVGYERALLDKYKDYQHRGEWFSFPKEILSEVSNLEI